MGGEGTIEKRIPAMMRMFAKYGIDIRKEPILVYPTLHYQNGGLQISTPDGMTGKVENLFVAGEAVGGIHGRNRLMGNSLLDIIVFGRSAGKNAAAKSHDVKVGELTLCACQKVRARKWKKRASTARSFLRSCCRTIVARARRSKRGGTSPWKDLQIFWKRS